LKQREGVLQGNLQHVLSMYLPKTHDLFRKTKKMRKIMAYLSAFGIDFVQKENYTIPCDIMFRSKISNG